MDAGWSMKVLAGRGPLGVRENFNDPKFMLNALKKVTSRAQAVGVRIVIHPPNTTALPMTEGFDVPPGVSASLALPHSSTHARR